MILIRVHLIAVPLTHTIIVRRSVSIEYKAERVWVKGQETHPNMPESKRIRSDASGTVLIPSTYWHILVRLMQENTVLTLSE